MARTSRSARSKPAGAGVRERRTAPTRESAGDPPPGKVSNARERLLRGVRSPVNVVLLTRRHIEDVVEDAVARGRMTRTDAQEMIQTLLSLGARATDDLLSDLERVLGRGGDSIDEPTAGSSQPIPGYDDLSAAAVQERLDGLAPAELRRLRDYEARHGNRKTVLDKIDRKLR